MKLCKKCQEDIRKGTAAGGLDYAGGYLYFPERDPVPELECQFWIHFAFNKVMGYLGWIPLTDEEKDKLFERMGKETPELIVELDKMMSNDIQNAK